MALERKPGSAPLILIVDDYADTRLVVKWSLEMRGYRVREAASGAEALQSTAEQKPDLILMDLNMPEMDGYAAIRTLRENETLRAVPIVAMTAQDRALSRDKSREAGCTDYVSKPIDFDRLDVLIDRLIAQRSEAS